MPFNPKALLDDGPVVLNVNLPDSQEEETEEIALHLGGKVSKIKDAVVAKGRKKRNTFYPPHGANLSTPYYLNKKKEQKVKTAKRKAKVDEAERARLLEEAGLATLHGQRAAVISI